MFRSFGGMKLELSLSGINSGCARCGGPSGGLRGDRFWLQRPPAILGGVAPLHFLHPASSHYADLLSRSFIFEDLCHPGGVGGVRGHLPSRGQLTSNHGSISASIPLRQPSAAGFRGAAASESWTALAGRRSAHRARSRKCQESQMKSSLLRVRAVLGVVSNEQTTVFAS